MVREIHFAFEFGEAGLQGTDPGNDRGLIAFHLT